MTTFTAHGMLVIRQERGDTTGWPCACPSDVFAPLLLTGYAVLSGWLPDAGTYQELLEAAEHGRTLSESGIVSDDDLADALADVAAELERAAESLAQN